MRTSGGEGAGLKMKIGLGDSTGLGDGEITGLGATAGLGEGDAKISGLGACATGLVETTGLGADPPTPLDPGGSGGDGGCGGLKFCPLTADAHASRRHRASPDCWAAMIRLADHTDRNRDGTRSLPAEHPGR